MGDVASRLLFAATLLCGTIAPSYAYDVKERVAEGVRLHDAGDFEGAIVIYRSVLKDHPHDPLAVYELAYSWMEQHENLEELAQFIEAELASGVEQSPQLPMMLGWAYDDLGRYDKAEAAFRRSVEALPGDARASYNLGVNLALQSRLADAAASYLEALRAEPGYVSAWNGLAVALEAQGRNARAFVAYARVAASEPDSKRGRAAAAKLWPLLFEGVEETNPGDATRTNREITVTIPVTSPEEPPVDAVAPKPESGDAGPMSEAKVVDAGVEGLSLSIVAATRYLETGKDQSEAEFFANALTSVTTIFSELDSAAKDPFWSLALPFFDEARTKGHMEALAYDVRRSAGDRDAEAWIAKHPKKVKAYAAWMGR